MISRWQLSRWQTKILRRTGRYTVPNCKYDITQTSRKYSRTTRTIYIHWSNKKIKRHRCNWGVWSESRRDSCRSTRNVWQQYICTTSIVKHVWKYRSKNNKWKYCKTCVDFGWSEKVKACWWIEYVTKMKGNWLPNSSGWRVYSIDDVLYWNTV